jgi:hypothetical protein
MVEGVLKHRRRLSIFLRLPLCCAAFATCTDLAQGPGQTGVTTATNDPGDFLRSLPVVDLHNDRSFFLTARQIPWPRCDSTQICAQRYKRAQYFFALFRPPPPYTAGRFGLSREQARQLDGMSHLDYLRQAIADLRAQTGIPISRDPQALGGAENRIFLGIEGAFLLDSGSKQRGSGDPATGLDAMIRELRSAGVSYIGLTWSNPNVYAGVAGEAQGLTERGRELVDLLLRRGMLLDLSHASDQSVRDVYRMTGGHYPLFFSHSSVRSICEHPRNLSDELLELVRASDGLVGVNFHTAYITCRNQADRKDVLRHIDYIARKYGVRHVALGGDFDGLIRLPRGLGGPPELHDLARDLWDAGYSRAEIEAIFFGNMRRVLRNAQINRD